MEYDADYLKCLNYFLIFFWSSRNVSRRHNRLSVQTLSLLVRTSTDRGPVRDSQNA